MSDLVASLKKMKFLDSLIIPLSVMFRFFYTLAKRRLSADQRSYVFTRFSDQSFFHHPLRMIEYRFVPLLMCLSRTADDMSISAMTRGIAVGQVRSSISRPRLSLLDYFWMLFMLVILVLMIWS